MVLMKPVDWEVQDGNMEWLGRRSAFIILIYNII